MGVALHEAQVVAELGEGRDEYVRAFTVVVEEVLDLLSIGAVSRRFGLEPMRLRDRTARNLADALDFSSRRNGITLPPFTAPAPKIC